MAAKSKIDTRRIADEIYDLEFTRSTYIRAERQSIGFAVSRLSDIPGSAAHLCKAITALEKVEALITRRIDSLKTKLPKEGK